MGEKLVPSALQRHESGARLKVGHMEITVTGLSIVLQFAAAINALRIAMAISALMVAGQISVRSANFLDYIVGREFRRAHARETLTFFGLTVRFEL